MVIDEMRFGEIPHPIPYQGSKRQLAQLILTFIPERKFQILLEPFVGSGAVTLATARKNPSNRFLVGDTLEPLCGIWHQIVADPQRLAAEYAELWHDQLSHPIPFFNKVREEFNCDRTPSKLLFLLARCVKNAVRFNPSGQFNQSADKRRLGTRPKTMKAEIEAAHRLLKGRCDIFCGDYKKSLDKATANDIVYMDPPYQGTSEGRDSRYFGSVDRKDLVSALEKLNERGVQFVLSYDGACGGRTYGEALPEHLRCKRVLVDTGRSSQATLNGLEHRTVESIYVSSGLANEIVMPKQFGVVPSGFVCEQSCLFE